MDKLEDIVHKVASEMGYPLLCDKQKQAILGFLRSRDVFVLEVGKVCATPSRLEFLIV